MQKMRLLFSLLAVVSLVLGACTRQASASPTAQNTQDPLQSIFNAASTQTALAAAGGGQLPPESGGGALEGASTATSTQGPSPTPTATLTPTLAPTTQVTVPAKYVLREGEFLFCLARRFDIDVDALAAANGYTRNTNFIPVGKELKIPAGAAKFSDGKRALKAHPVDYTVVAGDNIFRIACKFGDVWPEQIAQVNGIGLNAKLTVGQVLHIP